MMSAALATFHAGLAQIVLVAAGNAADIEPMLDVLARTYNPFSILVPVNAASTLRQVAHLLPFVAPMTPIDGRATAYVCRNFTCDQPVTDAAGLLERLRRPSSLIADRWTLIAGIQSRADAVRNRSLAAQRRLRRYRRR